jgi:hypothetical protein
MPVRSIPRNSRSLTGKVIDFRSHRPVAFESALERAFYIWLDCDPTVAAFEEQPVTIAYHDPLGVRRTYPPDVLVHYRAALTHQRHSRPLRYEMKYRDDLRTHWHDYRPKFQAARRYARAQGWGLRLITERAIRTPYLKNAKGLRQDHDRTLDRADGHRLLALLAEHGEMPPEALLASLSPDRWERARWLPGLWSLSAVGAVGADLTVPLTRHSRLWSLALAEDRGDAPRE